MMLNQKSTIIAAGLIATLALPTAVSANDAPTLVTDSRIEASVSAIEFRPDTPFETARLAISSAAGNVFHKTYGTNSTIRYDLTDDHGELLADGTYGFDLKWSQARREGEIGEVSRVSGNFRILNGLLHRDDEPEKIVNEPQNAVENYDTGDIGTNAELCVGCTSDFEPGSGAFGGEGIVVIGQSAGINLIGSESTSDLDTLGWEIGFIAGSGNFYVSDLGSDGGSETTPFKIEDDAPTGAIHIDDRGDVGLGTTDPNRNLHLANGAEIYFDDTAEWELDGGEDFSLTLWDNGSGTFLGTVVTVENNNAPTPSGVGVGIWRADPLATLHVGSPGGDGSAQVLVEESSATTARRQLFRLENNGPPEFALQDTSLDLEWKFGTRSSSFEINRSGSGQTEMLLRANGNLQIAGTLSQGSSRSLKRDFEAIDSREILDRVAELPLLEWSYRGTSEEERHFGPMAEDFHEIFGLGDRPDRLAPGDAAGIALSAIQGLNKIVTERDGKIAELEERVERLTALLEERLGEL